MIWLTEIGVPGNPARWCSNSTLSAASAVSRGAVTLG